MPISRITVAHRCFTTPFSTRVPPVSYASGPAGGPVRMRGWAPAGTPDDQRLAGRGRADAAALAASCRGGTDTVMARTGRFRWRAPVLSIRAPGDVGHARHGAAKRQHLDELPAVMKSLWDSAILPGLANGRLRPPGPLAANNAQAGCPLRIRVLMEGPSPIEEPGPARRCAEDPSTRGEMATMRRVSGMACW